MPINKDNDMSLQAHLNKEAIDQVIDIKNFFDDKDHPHTDHTIVQFFCNYKKPFDSLSPSEVKEFRTDLKAELSRLVEEYK